MGELNRGWGRPAERLPAFGAGVTAQICRLGDPTSKHVIVELGDSQAGTWMGALQQVAKREHLAVVPLVKPGCFVTRLHEHSRLALCLVVQVGTCVGPSA